jgi:redox-sensitive bicupin YhaK (pirin superfamily)
VSAGSVSVLKAADRFLSRADGVLTHHCFSFGEHYDPANTSYGALVAFNDTVLKPGAGFASHRHAGVEIVTWVLDGTLHHEDSTGHRGDILPGVVQRLSAGDGVVHTETSAPDPAAAYDHGTRFVQMWLRPDESGGPPDYAQVAVDAATLEGGLVVVASGRPRDRGTRAVQIRCSGAALHVGRLTPGQSVQLPSAALVFVYVARGAVAMGPGQPLAAGDSARLTGTPEAGGVRALEPAEILVWEMDVAS